MKSTITTFLFCSLAFVISGQELHSQTQTTAAAAGTSTKKMKIEIWSDVVCPFCYIGKRKLEQALEQFPHRDQVEITWKSFQLDPETPVNGGDYLQYLATRKGWSLDYTRQLTQQVTQMASNAGLEYHLEKAITANSFDAHRVAHLASTKGLGDGMAEALFKAHFVEGKSISDHKTLTEIGTAVGLEANEVSQLLASKQFTEEVQKDIQEARQLQISGVPFFVVDRKYAISGAQDTSVFLQTLQAAFESNN
ncbi:MAG: DsbA family oxidoreductase [Saprospiraceae bacterium]|nr:DsbA family oxidoreductase [Saprospiraceae bacterium]